MVYTIIFYNINFKGFPYCVECKKGYFLAPNADITNFGGNDCLLKCINQTRSIVYSKLEIDVSSNQVLNKKGNSCFTNDENLFLVEECLFYGPAIIFETFSSPSFQNRCFKCYSYSFTVISFADNGLSGNIYILYSNFKMLILYLITVLLITDM